VKTPERPEQESQTAPQATWPLGVGQVLVIRLPTFTAQITIRSQRELTVQKGFMRLRGRIEVQS
jgi:hypothetical protein